MVETTHLGIADLAKYFGISESKMYEMQAEGDFPAPCHFGTKKVWKIVEAEEYFKRHPDQRRVRRATARKGGA